MVHHGGVRRVLWLSMTVIGLLIIGGVTMYLWSMGLERSDKLSSGIGAIAGLAPLLVGIVQLVRGGTESRPRTPTTVNMVNGPNHGRLVQADTINGDIHMGRRD
jgi:hypothetical protein